MAHSEREQGTDLDSEDDFDALEIDSVGSQAASGDLRHQNTTAFNANRPREGFDTAHKSHTCGVCRPWDLFTSQERPGSECYTFQAYERLRERGVDNCVFVDLCRRQLFNFPDGGRMVIDLEMDANTGAPAVGSLVTFKLDPGCLSKPRDILSGFIHPS